LCCLPLRPPPLDCPFVRRARGAKRKLIVLTSIFRKQTDGPHNFSLFQIAISPHFSQLLSTGAGSAATSNTTAPLAAQHVLTLFLFFFCVCVCAGGGHATRVQPEGEILHGNEKKETSLLV